MLIGNPDKFALLLEKVPEWSTSYVNGLLFVMLNGEIYPKTVRTATLNCELPELLNENSPFMNPVISWELYYLKSKDLFQRLATMTYPENSEQDNDYHFSMIALHEIYDSGYCLFIVSNGKNVRIQVGQWENEELVFIDETEISTEELNEIQILISEFERDMYF